MGQVGTAESRPEKAERKDGSDTYVGKTCCFLCNVLFRYSLLFYGMSFFKFTKTISKEITFLKATCSHLLITRNDQVTLEAW